MLIYNVHYIQKYLCFICNTCPNLLENKNIRKICKKPLETCNSSSGAESLWNMLLCPLLGGCSATPAGVRKLKGHGCDI